MGEKQANSGSWKPGQSGNPKGRPPKGQSFAEILRQVGEEFTPVPGIEDKISKMEAISRKLWAEASKGEAWAIRELLDRIDGKPKQNIVSENESKIVIEHEIADPV